MKWLTDEKKMKKIITLIYILLLLLSIQSVNAKVLKIATIAPDGTGWMKQMREGAKQVKKLTDGRVVLKFYPGGVMGNDGNVLRKMRIGQLQGGAVTAGSLEAIDPDIGIYGLPFLFSSLSQVDTVRKNMDARILAELENRGYVSFGLAEGGFSYMMSDEKLNTVDDVRHQKVWMPSGNKVGTVVFKHAGVSPVSLPLSDVMTGLQTGLIDTVITSPIGALALQWHTKIRYVVDVPLTYYSALMVMSKKAFSKLKADDQLMVREVMGKVFRNIDAQNRKDNIAARQALINQGIEFIELAPDALAEWHHIGDVAMHELEQKNNYTRSVYDALMDNLKAAR
jgi:TRAP-type C4-dicarboxylate transport system substrate-binding protein